MKPATPAISLLLIMLAASTPADEMGSIQFYLDISCSNPSGEPVLKPINDCAEAGGSSEYLSIDATSFPPCPSGQASLEITDAASCGPPSISPIHRTSEAKDCLTLPNGMVIASAAFQCLDPNAVATTQKAATTTAPSPKPSTSDDPRRRYSVSDTIALGIGIGIGLPTFLVSALACCFGKEIGRLRLPYGEPREGSPPPPYAP